MQIQQVDPPKMRQVENHLGDSFTKDHLTIYANEPGPGGASHYYQVTAKSPEGVEYVIAQIDFQKGPRLEVGINGILEGTLLQIILDRQNAFQAGEYRCRENALAITKLEEALLWLKARELERASRKVLGTTAK
jgi:hypothetical protein